VIDLIGSMCAITKEDLQKLVISKLAGHLFVVVSNREPYIHKRVGDHVECETPASGLTVALDPVMRACGGIWIAHGSGDADRVMTDNQDKVAVPPEKPEYTLRRLWLTKEEEDGYYYGFSNGAFWPLCHICYTEPVFNESDWHFYRMVNERFAQVVLEEIGNRKAFVFIQDYHLALLPHFIKKANPDTIVAQFWHIPWPGPEVIRICPWHKEILQGLLGNDLLGFHVHYYCNNFMDTVDWALETRVNRENHEVIYKGKRTSVQHFPISIDYDSICEQAQQSDVTEEMNRLRQDWRLNRHSCPELEFIGIGIDRLDYTKGIPHRLRAIDRFLEKYPYYKGKLAFIQVGVPSRTHIEAYKNIDEEVESMVEKINWKHAIGYWKPIIYSRKHHSPLSMMALHRMAHFCIVSSLHDGMNMVAKEFVASRFDEDGVLILSSFTGAARELTDALMVNPYATDELAEAIRQALEMNIGERQKRMRRMRSIVREHNIYKWAEDIITYLAKFDLTQHQTTNR